MGRRGPQPAPTALKLVMGEERPSRLNRDEPDLPPPASLKPPAGLTGEGRREWERLVTVLTEAGVLREADMGAFSDYCLCVSDLRRAEAKARRLGLELSIAKGVAGMVVKLRAQVAQLRAHLGLTPSSRTSVRATPQRSQQPNPLDRFLKGQH